MEAVDVSHFRSAILEGAWTQAEAMLERLGLVDTDGLMVST